jgi:hypothetical protein
MGMLYCKSGSMMESREWSYLFYIRLYIHDLLHFAKTRQERRDRLGLRLLLFLLRSQVQEQLSDIRGSRIRLTALDEFVSQVEPLLISSIKLPPSNVLTQMTQNVDRRSMPICFSRSSSWGPWFRGCRLMRPLPFSLYYNIISLNLYKKRVHDDIELGGIPCVGFWCEKI